MVRTSPSPSAASSATTATTSSSDRRPTHSRLLRGGIPMAASSMAETVPLLLPVKRDDVSVAVAPPVESPPLASDAKTFVSCIIAFLGSGVLGFPYAFKQTGIVLGLTLLVTVGALTAFCMLLVVECKYKIKTQRGITVSTYGDIGAVAMGPLGQWIVNLSLVVSQAGFAVAYLIFISVNVSVYFGISKQLVVMLCVPPLVAFCLLRHIKHLAYVALVADVLNLTGLAVVFAADFTYIDVSAESLQEAAPAPNALASLNWLGTLSSVPFFFGVATYCFAGIGMALPLENAMENKRHFRRILLQVISLIGSIYGTFGICGYLAFGSEIRDVITLNIAGHGSLATIVKLCLCGGLLCACPMMLFPVFEVLQPACLSPLRLHDHSARRERSVITLFRSCVVLVVAVIAGGAPSFGVFISFIGSTCCSCLGFVLPVVFHLTLFHDAHSTRSKLGYSIIMVLGLLAVAAGFYSAGSSMF